MLILLLLISCNCSMKKIDKFNILLIPFVPTFGNINNLTQTRQNSLNARRHTETTIFSNDD